VDKEDASVNEENTSTNQATRRWFIDLDWHQQSNRLFFALAQGCLCPKCQKRLKGEISAADLLTIIKDCCSKAPNFIPEDKARMEAGDVVQVMMLDWSEE